MQIEKNKKIQGKQFVRSETLGIPLDTPDGDTRELLFKSDDPEFLYIYEIIQDEKLNFLGSIDTTNFLALCRRALEFWEKE